MDVSVHRENDPRSLNAIINDPDVAPYISGGAPGGNFDLAPIVSNPENVNLIGEHGGMLARHVSPGIYEIHTHVLKRGRGEWAVGMCRAALHHLFTRTGAVEILTKVPKGNLAARAMVRVFDGVFQFTAPSGWVMDGQPVPADVFSWTIQHWARGNAAIEERGQWFYRKLATELRLQGHPATFSADEVSKMGAAKAIGLAFEMIAGAQHGKAEAFYRRWAFMTGAQPIEILHPGPPTTVKFGDVLLIVRPDDFWVPHVQADHATLQ